MTIHRTAATTSRSGPTIWRSRMRCPRWRNGSGRWGRPRRRFSRKTAGRNTSRSLGLEREALQEARQVRPRFAVRARDRLEGGRVVHVRGHALRDALLEGRHVLVLVEHADRDPVSPFEGLLQRLRGLLLDLGRIADHRIIALVLELVDAGQRSTAPRILPILAPVPLLRVQVVVRRARLQDIEEGVSFVLDPRLNRRDEMLDIVRVAAADPCRARREGQPDRVDGLVDIRVGERLRLNAELEGRRGLALRQPVDAVVVDDVQHVQVPAAGVHEVSPADSKPVAFAAFPRTTSWIASYSSVLDIGRPLYFRMKWVISTPLCSRTMPASCAPKFISIPIRRFAFARYGRISAVGNGLIRRTWR